MIGGNMNIISLIPSIYSAACILWVLSWIVLVVRGVSIIMSYFANKKPSSMNVLLTAGIVHALTTYFAWYMIDRTLFNIAAVIVLVVISTGVLTSFVFLLNLFLIRKETGQQDK